MDYRIILNKIESIFVDLGFKPVKIHNVKFMKYKECYCQVTYLKDLSAVVIENADNISDAEKGVLEDGDLYYINIPEDDILNQIKSDLKNYYMD